VLRDVWTRGRRRSRRWALDLAVTVEAAHRHPDVELGGVCDRAVKRCKLEGSANRDALVSPTPTYLRQA